MTLQDILKSTKIYKYDEVETIYNLISDNLNVIKTKKKGNFYNIPCSFDIETTSFIQNNDKIAIMYEWTIGIYGYVIIGRTWEELIQCFESIHNIFETSNDFRIIFYVHNLSYEFQYIRKHFEWEKVFSIDSRKPIYAITTTGIEFRCSYLLSGYSLEKVGSDLQKYKVNKLVGNLDYSLIRHTNTPMTQQEIDYCVNDVKVVMCYIQECIENDGDITKIPLTKTGYVRKYVRNSCFVDKQNKFKRINYYDLMQSMKLSVEEYKQLKRAFQGGFAHACPFYSGITLENVYSDDFTSSYPSVMISEKFPVGSCEIVPIRTQGDLQHNIKNYCCLFDVCFINIRPRKYYENYISISRCWNTKNVVKNNGRVVSADMIYTTLTEQDYIIIRYFYEWDELRIGTFRRYMKDYLPTDFVKAILKLYEDKTKLKNVEGKEVDYLKSKEMLNSCYGMVVTDIIRDEHTYTNSEEWGLTVTDFSKAIYNYNNDRNRFNFYPWGVWTTAYARRNLFTGIIEFGETDDYVYCDTDSIKSLNREKHIDFLQSYNETITKKLEKALDHHKLPHDLICPKTVDGKEKPLGVWDYEGKYDKFKTLGAKRYMVEEDGKHNITVSGLNKKVCVPYLEDKYKDNIFDSFNSDLYVPHDYTGKNTHTYIDEEKHGIITDYLGNTQEFHELSSIHLSKSDYSLSIAEEYTNYLLCIQYE